MTQMNPQNFSHTLLELLRETFEGTDGQGSHSIDGKGRASLFETLERTPAALASTPLRSGGVTIAAHTEHTRYYLETVRQFMSGAEPQTDWPGSWRLREVDAEAWKVLKRVLRTEYQTTRSSLERIEVWSDDAVADALSILAHSAYHLGAIRLLVVSLV